MLCYDYIARMTLVKHHSLYILRLKPSAATDIAELAGKSAFAALTGEGKRQTLTDTRLYVAID